MNSAFLYPMSRSISKRLFPLVISRLPERERGAAPGRDIPLETSTVVAR